jgi:AraC-like DNA-binding protein
MSRSVEAVFDELDDFQSALGQETVLSLVPTHLGEFRARLNQVTLHRLSLSVVNERLPRIAYIAVPPGKVLVCLAVRDRPSIWGGTTLDDREMLCLGAGQQIHMRTDGPCRWSLIQISAETLTEYGQAMLGARFALPSWSRCRPPSSALRRLQHFHRVVCRVEGRPATVSGEAAHGLEQQVIHELLECLSGFPLDEVQVPNRLINELEELLARKPIPPTPDIATTLGASRRILDECCLRHLGIGLDWYRRLRVLQAANRVLRKQGGRTTNIAEVARECGFKNLSRFAEEYRAIYGELPAMTLRRSADDVIIQ